MPVFLPRRCLGLLILALSVSPAAEKWQLQYFYDRDQETLEIADICFPSPARGVAAGVIRKEKGDREDPVVLVTRDGGANWSPVRIKEPPVSLFFLNETIGWMVGRRDLWLTLEAGNSWQKLKAPDELLRVYFLDEQRGFGVGHRKKVWSTADGGRGWTELKVTEQIESNPDFTSFGWIDFATPRVGIISGWSRRPRRGSPFPDWMSPEEASRRRQIPSLTVLIETNDGGATWKPSTASMFGRITRIRLLPAGWGLGLLEFDDQFSYPSEVFELKWNTGGSERVYRDPDHHITDIAVPRPDGPRYLAGFQTVGNLAQAPVPGKVTILKSLDGRKWSPMDVDYRAVARRVILAGTPDGQVWAATDTGMILKLTTLHD